MKHLFCYCGDDCLMTILSLLGIFIFYFNNNENIYCSWRLISTGLKVNLSLSTSHPWNKVIFFLIIQILVATRYHCHKYEINMRLTDIRCLVWQVSFVTISISGRNTIRWFADTNPRLALMRSYLNEGCNLIIVSFTCNFILSTYFYLPALFTTSKPSVIKEFVWSF